MPFECKIERQGKSDRPCPHDHDSLKILAARFTKGGRILSPNGYFRVAGHGSALQLRPNFAITGHRPYAGPVFAIQFIPESLNVERQTMFEDGPMTKLWS